MVTINMNPDNKDFLNMYISYTVRAFF